MSMKINPTANPPSNLQTGTSAPAVATFTVSAETQQQAKALRAVEAALKAKLGEDGYTQLEQSLGGAMQKAGFGAATGPVPPNGTVPNLTNHGGAVLTTPVLHNIYVGDYFNQSAGQADRTQIESFTQDFGKSKLMDVLAQYGAGASTAGNSTVVAGASPTTVTESQVQTYVKNAIASNAVSKDAQGIYTVVLPPNTVLDAGGGTTSKQGLGGFHGSYQDPATGQPVYYAVIAYSDTKGNGIDFDGNSQDAINITQSHEWAEAMTDPDVNSPIAGRGLGWYDDTNGEIGDLAIGLLPLNQTFEKDAAGNMEQLEWSNQQKQYEIDTGSINPPPPPPPGTVTGSATPGAPLSSGKTATSSISIGKDLAISKLTVSLNLQHTSSRGLTVTLTSPSGKSQTVPVKAGKTIQGNFDLTAFAGESSKGNWTLSVKDGSKRDTGTFNSWALNIQGQ